MENDGDDREEWPLVARLSLPAAILDEECRIVFLNAGAEAFWGLRFAEVAGRAASQALKIGPCDGAPLDGWLDAIVRRVAGDGTAVCAETGGADGTVHVVELSAMRVAHGGHRYTQLMLREQRLRQQAPPGARDPATGLIRFHEGIAEYGLWNGRDGAVILFDLETLRDTNALYGSSAGDAVLAAAGEALAAQAPEGALAGRCGDDELVLVLGRDAVETAHGTARRIAERVAREVKDSGVPVAPGLHYGVSRFVPGGLGAALQQAKDLLYEQRRGLLRASSGGRIVLTREGRAELQEPGGEAPAAAPGAFASYFTTEFDSYFRQLYARAIEQAREFVAFANPERGTAVVEVGAGSGRVTFDGGLAERVGPSGQLLVTDPSPAQLQVARKQATERGCDWVRFVCAPVEALPVEPGTADLCLGALFLHFAEPSRAIRAMARVVRPAGRVAICAVLDVDWPAPWLEILAPVRNALRLHGLPGVPFGSRLQLEREFRAAGLTIDAAEELLEPGDYRTPEIAVAAWRQTRMTPVMLKGLPADAVPDVEKAVEARIRDVWSRTDPHAMKFVARGFNIIGHR